MRPRLRPLDAVEPLEQARQLSAGMPVPVSATVSTTVRSCARSATAIPPSNVNLNAFESRLRTIFSHMSRST